MWFKKKKELPVVVEEPTMSLRAAWKIKDLCKDLDRAWTKETFKLATLEKPAGFEEVDAVARKVIREFLAKYKDGDDY